MLEEVDPTGDFESVQLYTVRQEYVIWLTPYQDHDSIWVSDLLGYELESFDNVASALRWITAESERHAAR